MYSNFNYQIAQDRIADVHHQAQRDALARAARQPQTRQSGHRAFRLPVIAVRRLLIALGAHT